MENVQSTKTITDYLVMIEKGCNSEDVSSSFIVEQPKMLHKITNSIYKTFKNNLEYDDVFQESCLAVFNVFNDYANNYVTNKEKLNSVQSKKNYAYSAIRYRVLVSLNEKYAASGCKMDERIRKRIVHKTGYNPFAAVPLEPMLSERSEDEYHRSYSPKALAETTTPEDIVVRDEELAEIKSAFTVLSDNEKKVLNLVLIDGKTIREAAKDIGMSKSSVSYIKLGAVQKIKDCLAM